MLETLGVLILLLVALAFMLPYLRSGTKFGAPFVPMDKEAVNRVMKLGEVGPGKKFYDLGSGDGRLVIAAALRGADAVGIEIDKIRVFYSNLWIKLLRLGDKAKIIRGNIFDHDYSDADIINLYLLEETNDKLRPKLEKELRPGTVIVATAFKVNGWKPEKVDLRGTVYGPIYVYKRE